MKNKYFGEIELTDFQQWSQFSADSNFRKAKSAYEVAKSWHGQSGFPPRVKSALESITKNFGKLEELRGTVEKPVWLDTSRAPSMTDLMVYCQFKRGDRMVVGVEAKADESFAEEIRKWVIEKGQVSPSKLQRLEFLNQRLGMKLTEESSIRYQLLHRTYSVISECVRHAADHGVLLIQSFSNKKPGNWEDFKAFAKELGLEVQKGEPVKWECDYPFDFYFVWVEDDPSKS